MRKGEPAWNKGKKLGPLSSEHRAKVSAALKGKKHTAEHVAKCTRPCLPGCRCNRHRPLTAAQRAVRRIKMSAVGAMRARPIWAEFQQTRSKRWYRKCPDGRWRLRAHVVWEQANGPIPPGHVIHHHNENVEDDRLSNLRCWMDSEHKAYHNKQRRKMEAA